MSTSSRHRFSRAGYHVYRALLRLYPRPVRQDFGYPMSQLFGDMLEAEHRHGGWWASVRFAVRAYADMPLSAFTSHRDDRRSRRSGRAVATRAGEGGAGGAGGGGERDGDTGWNARFEGVFHDLRYSLRSLAKEPGFTAVAIVTLALGIGANTAIFSVVNAVLFRPLPYRDAGELVTLFRTANEAGAERLSVSGPDLLDIRRQTETLREVAGAWGLGTSITGDGDPEQITLSWVSTNYFDLLGITPIVGRAFRPDDKLNLDVSVVSRPGFVPPPGAVILSHGLWQQRYAGDPDVLGRTLEINGQPMEVIGVAPPAFRLYLAADAALPTGVDAWTLFPVDLSRMPRGGGNLTVLGRLADGVSVTQSQRELDLIAAGLRNEYEVHDRLGTAFEVRPLHGEVVGHVRPLLWLLSGAVGLVLLIACANVANLLLVRSTNRRRELAIRAALGCGRGRIARQVLTESVVLSTLGAAAGLLFAVWGIDLLIALRPGNLPRIQNVDIDRTVLGFTVTASVVAALLFGSAPAVQSFRTNLTDALKNRGGGGMRGARLRSVLAVSEVALSLVLLIGAGLLMRSFVLLQRVDPGFNAAGVVTMNMSLPFFGYRDTEKRVRLMDQLVAQVDELPGVTRASAVTPLPLATRDNSEWTGQYALNEENEEEWLANVADYRPVLQGYFATLAIPVLQGRTFARGDNEPNAPPVIVIDDVLAQRIWPDQNPVGERLVTRALNETSTGSVTQWAEVVGVVAHARHSDLTREGRGTIYTPYRTSAWFEVALVVRTSRPIDQVVGDVRRELATLDPALPVFNVRPLGEYVDDALAPTRFALIAIGVFAAVAMVLASVGLYGVIAYMVRQRAREIGVRMALGADQAGILRLVVSQGMVLTGVGVVAGLVTTAALARVLSSMLFGITARDPVTYLTIATILVGVALLACIVPARRASRVDPVLALREE